jgi:hypothetical protein
MQVQFNTIQSNYNPQFQALTKFNHEEIKKGLKVTKWVDGIIGAETKLKNLAKDVNIAVTVTPNDKKLDSRSVQFTVSEIGGAKREISGFFYPYVWDDVDVTTDMFKDKFLRKVQDSVEKFKAITAIGEYRT